MHGNCTIRFGLPRGAPGAVASSICRVAALELASDDVRSAASELHPSM